MTLSVKNIQEHFGVSEHTVLGWIRSGELRAINTARKPGTRPKWRVTAEALATFEQLRTSQPPTPKTRRRRGKSNSEVIEFIK